MKSNINNVRILFFIISAIFAMLNIFLQVLPITANDYLQVFLNRDASQIAYVSSLFLVSYAILQIPSGVLIDHYGIKRVLPIAIFITAIGCIYFMFSNSLSSLGLSRLVTGIGCSVSYICGIFVAVQYFPKIYAAFLIAILEATSTSGAILAGRFFKILLQKFGWYYTNWIIVGFCCILLFICIYCIRILEKLTVTHYDTNTSFNCRSLRDVFSDLIYILKNTKIVCLFVYSFSTWLIIMSFAGLWLKRYLINMHGFSDYQALMYPEYYWYSFLVFSIFVGFFIRTYQQTKLIIIILAILGVLTYYIMMIPILFSQRGLVLVAIAGGISASGLIFSFSIIPYWIEERFVGTAIAANNMFIVLGGYLGQLLFGELISRNLIAKYIHFNGIHASYYSGLFLYAVFSLVALIAILLAVSVKHNNTHYYATNKS